MQKYALKHNFAEIFKSLPIRTMAHTIPSLIKASIDKHRTLPAMSFVEEKPITYGEMDSNVHSLIAYFEKIGIKPNDKVAILSANIPNWGITYLAITFMGAVAVPLLPDFSAIEIENVLNHSDAKVIFVSKGLLYKIENFKNDLLTTRINIENFDVLTSDKPDVKIQMGQKPVNTYSVNEDDLAVIIYTSGTTGKSKGVMLTQKNIAVNVWQSSLIQPVNSDDRFLSLLPLSHTLENTLGMILPLSSGANVFYLRKPPTPSVLLPALEKIRPTLMLTVPMIIEKIFKSKIEPAFNKSAVIRAMYKVPFIRKKLNEIAGKKLKATFGGCMKFFGIGGAKLNRAVEAFLIDAKFPYAIGYGLTETAPLIAGAAPGRTILGSTGIIVADMQIKINDPDPITGEGEIWAKGPNVMKGYYKEPGITKEVLTEDGWFRTGDLGVFDNKQNLYIKGRLKNMILGANGENIYPEEIESVINNFRFVVDSLVMQKKGRLVAMVHFNREELELRYQHLKAEVSDFVEKKMEELKIELQQYLNQRLSKFARVEDIELHPVPFDKTATQKIRRFLYAA